MPQENQDRLRIAGALARRVKEGADAAQIAFVVTTAMGVAESNLRPIIGKGGVVALYRRSLHLVGTTHPWLKGSDSAKDEIDLAALQSRLGQQGAAGAADAGAALLQTFRDLFASLVGSSLSERLLSSAWAEL